MGRFLWPRTHMPTEVTEQLRGFGEARAVLVVESTNDYRHGLMGRVLLSDVGWCWFRELLRF